MMPAAVNCLVIEPVLNTVSDVLGTPSDRTAIPYPLSRMTLPSLATNRAPEKPKGVILVI